MSHTLSMLKLRHLFHFGREWRWCPFCPVPPWLMWFQVVVVEAIR